MWSKEERVHPVTAIPSWQGQPGYAPAAPVGGDIASELAPLRHPLDPDPVPSTKAFGVLALGIVACMTAPVVGGVIPAVMALSLARAARAEMIEAQGFLIGGRWIRLGERLAWIAVVIVLTVVVIGVVAALLRYGDPTAPQNFDSTVD